MIEVKNFELLYLLIMIPIALVWAYRDGWLIRVKLKSPNHTTGWILRVAVAVGVTLIVFNQYLIRYELIRMCVFTVLEGFVFWMIFDPMVNVLRFKNWSKWDYIGSSAKQDKFQRSKKITADVALVTKFVITGLLLMVYTLI